MRSSRSIVRWGILGTGGIARRFTRDLARARGAVAAAVASRTPARARAFAHEHDIARVHGSYEELVADPAIDVVYVATTNDQHPRAAIACALAGKAVLCEKPFACDAHEARAMVATAREHGVFCMEGMWSRFLPLMREVRRLVDDGAIGDPRLVTAELGMALSLDRIPRIADPRLGGGALLDLGVYPLALASWLLGQPSEVAAQVTMAATGVDEQGVAALRYPGGRLATVAFSFAGNSPSDATIVGTRGAIHLRGPLYRPRAAYLTRWPAAAAPDEPTEPDTGSAQRLASAVARGGALLARLRARHATRIGARHSGQGYHYEAAEVMERLERGERESPIMPLDETVAIMETVDRIRSSWSVADVLESRPAPRRLHR